MISMIKNIIGITSNDYDVCIIFLCIAFTLYFMVQFFNFISAIFNGANR